MGLEETHSGFATVQPLFRADNFTGNRTKVNSRDFCYFISLFICGCLLGEWRLHGGEEEEVATLKTTERNFRRVDANLLGTHLPPALILGGGAAALLDVLGALHPNSVAAA